MIQFEIDFNSLISKKIKDFIEVSNKAEAFRSIFRPSLGLILI
jgi:hypothetical protein